MTEEILPEHIAVIRHNNKNTLMLITKAIIIDLITITIKMLKGRIKANNSIRMLRKREDSEDPKEMQEHT